MHSVPANLEGAGMPGYCHQEHVLEEGDALDRFANIHQAGKGWLKATGAVQ